MRHILLMLALAVSASGQQLLTYQVCDPTQQDEGHHEPCGLWRLFAQHPRYDDASLLAAWIEQQHQEWVQPKLEYQPVWLIDGRRAYLTCPDDKRQDCTLSVISPSKKREKKAKPSGLIVDGNLYHKFCPPYDPCDPSGHAVSTHTKAGK